MKFAGLGGASSFHWLLTRLDASSNSSSFKSRRPPRFLLLEDAKDLQLRQLLEYLYHLGVFFPSIRKLDSSRPNTHLFPLLLLDRIVFYDDAEAIHPRAEVQQCSQAVKNEWGSS